MMEVYATDDPRVQIEISVPVKGRRPMMLRLPRFEYIDEPIYDEMMAALEAIDAAEAAAEAPMVTRKRNRAITLTTLKPFLSPKDYAVCETLPVGQLDNISEVWRELSAIPLGEYVASKTSSTVNTEAPSSTISTPTVITAPTSDAA
jgi:hypothetical protein